MRRGWLSRILAMAERDRRVNQPAVGASRMDRPKRNIHAMYAYERFGGWHRMVSLKMPERRGALDGPAAAPAF